MYFNNLTGAALAAGNDFVGIPCCVPASSAGRRPRGGPIL